MANGALEFHKAMKPFARRDFHNANKMMTEEKTSVIRFEENAVQKSANTISLGKNDSDSRMMGKESEAF